MATRTINTRLALDGEQEFKKQMSSVNGELRTLKSEMGYVDAQFKGQANSMEALTAKEKILRQEIEAQNKKVAETEKVLKEAETAQVNLADAMEKVRQKAEQAGVSIEKLRGDTKDMTDDEKALAKELFQVEASYASMSNKVQEYRTKLNQAKTYQVNFNRELQDTEKYLDEAKESSDGCAKSIDGFGKKAESSGGLLEKFGGNLKALGVAGVAGAAVAGVKAVTEAAFELVESTEEYRKIMGTLEVSSQAAGYSAEQTAETYNHLYSVLGDNQTAATTVANLQAIGLEQEQVRQTTDATIGAWAKYGDSIPIDGLAEAINETVQVGKVTGTFADVLNWAGQSEDDFNAKLEACSTASERANLVLQAMSQQGLAEAGQAWMETNKDIVANNEATAKMEAAQARLAEKLVPLTAGLKTLGAEALMGVLDAGEEVADFFFNDIPEALDTAEAYFEELPEHLMDVISEFGEIGRNVVDGFINGVKEKWTAAVSAVTGFVDNVKGVFTGSEGFDTHSPSKWSEAMFGNVIEGMILGNERNAARAIASAQETTEGMLDALTIPSNRELSARLSLSGEAAGGDRRSGEGRHAAAAQKAENFVINLTAMLDSAVVARHQYKYIKREGELQGGSLVEVTG